MYLFLIRHAESEKNKDNHFSSMKDDESLTTKGEMRAIEIAKNVSDFLKQHSYKCNIIYSANSIRSIKTAEIIASSINAKIQIEEDLRSTRPGVLAGMKKDEVKKVYPEYAQQYYLFEKGVFNLYNINNPKNKEPKLDYEQRVNACVDRIVSDQSEDIKIIIGHRSSITAILLYYARKYHNYPECFSGHIPLDLGYISILKKIDNKWEIIKVNENSLAINELHNMDMIEHETNESIPNQLLGIQLIEEIDRLFHLQGYNKGRTKLGEILKDINRDETETNIENIIKILIDSSGWANYKENNVEFAISNIVKGVQLANDNNLFFWAAKGERHLAGIEFHRDNNKVFLDHFDKSKEYTKQIQNKSKKNEMEGSLHLLKAKYLLKQNMNLSKAEEEAKEAKKKWLNDLQREIKVYAVLGNIYLKQRKWVQAYNMFFEGYNKSKNVRNDEKAKNALGLAQIHTRKELIQYFNPIKAQEYSKEAHLIIDSLEQL